jgi:hypothetical protein
MRLCLCLIAQPRDGHRRMKFRMFWRADGMIGKEGGGWEWGVRESLFEGLEGLACGEELAGSGFFCGGSARARVYLGKKRQVWRIEIAFT